MGKPCSAIVSRRSQAAGDIIFSSRLSTLKIVDYETYRLLGAQPYLHRTMLYGFQCESFWQHGQTNAWKGTARMKTTHDRMPPGVIDGAFGELCNPGLSPPFRSLRPPRSTLGIRLTVPGRRLGSTGGGIFPGAHGSQALGKLVGRR